jgi:hypothetical protein
MVELYFHSPICLYGVVLNSLSPWLILPLPFYSITGNSKCNGKSYTYHGALCKCIQAYMALADLWLITLQLSVSGNMSESIGKPTVMHLLVCATSVLIGALYAYMWLLVQALYLDLCIRVVKNGPLYLHALSSLLDRGVELTSHLQLVPRSRKCGSIHPLPHTSSWCNAWLVKHRGNFIFTLKHLKY